MFNCWRFFVFEIEKRSKFEINQHYLLNLEFFSLINDDKIFFKSIMLILISNNFYLWIEELKDLALKIKIWEYIDSYDKIEESRKKILLKISHFVVKQSDLTSSTAIDVSTTRELSNRCERVQTKKEANRQNHSKNAQDRWSNSCFN
jgi:hypothetical protein